MISRKQRVLGLFPYFGAGSIGGVQASARIAWRAVNEHTNGNATLLCYADTPGRAGSEPGAAETPETIVVHSKGAAVSRALAGKWPHELVFVWHLGLLRLLPFLRLPGARVVLILLGIEAWRTHGWFTRKQLEKVDLFLSISDHTWREFVSANPRFQNKPHETLLLGIGEPLTVPSRAPASRPAALMLSRLSKAEDYKGHREVINVWTRVCERIPDAELWIAGDGDLREDLEQLVARLGLNERVRFLGQVTDEEKQRLLQDARCLVMPSRGEGFGLVYLEAMRVGRPCLVSTLDAGREVVNPPEAGLAVSPDDASALTGALCRLLSEGAEWQRWSAQARRRFEQNYTAAHFEKRLLAALFSEPLAAPAASQVVGIEFSHV
jgi:phosphatidylinositol alpha-1,6-mannosyltransferase